MKKNLYLEHIESIPELIAEVFPVLNNEAARIAEEVSDWPLQSVYLYGSGDSWAAALGATGAFMKLCGLPSYAFTSMQASRYAPGYCMPAPKSVLIIGISSSGYMRRGVEATMSMNQAGYYPILLTSNPQSPGGQAADMIFYTPVPKFDTTPVPGVRSYMAAQISLYLLAVHLSLRKGKISHKEADKIIEALSHSGVILSAALRENRSILQAFGKLCAKEERVEFLAAGPCRASADFGMAKTLEATGYTALSPELEEFAHMNFFSLDPQHIPTVLICSEDARCLTRCLEIELSMKYQQRPYIVITDSHKFSARPDQTVLIPSSVNEIFSPMLFSFLTACLTAYMPLREGDTYMHGHQGPYFEGPFEKGNGFPTIMNSKIILK